MAEQNPTLKVKTELHPNNKHRSGYDFDILQKAHPELQPFVTFNKYEVETIDWASSKAVLALNTALLKAYYNIIHWTFPKGYLCPPIPGRADHIHHIATLLSEDNNDNIPTGAGIRCLDIGIGANCIYPIIGNAEYGWSFVGSDIDLVAIESAQAIANANPTLKPVIELRTQSKLKNILHGIIQDGEYFDVALCNPPFHATLSEAEAENVRKQKKLTKKKTVITYRNFGGQGSELYTLGGERKFVTNYIAQSKLYPKSALWYTCLISKESNLKPLYAVLSEVNALKVKTLEMGQGNKKARILAWTYQTQTERADWAASRWPKAEE